MSTSQTSCGSFQVLIDARQTETTDISLDVLPSSTETECTESAQTVRFPQKVLIWQLSFRQYNTKTIATINQRVSIKI